MIQLEEFQQELDLAVFEINRTYHMGMEDLRRRLLGKPGADKLGMTYQDGGKTEVYVMGDIKVSVPAGTDQDRILAALTNPFNDLKKKVKLAA